MSNVSAAPDLDFWEFVNCGICHLEFVKENGTLSTVPFWLTECGHVVCNSHINPDHSCSECGGQGVQLMPLARELEPPMSQWFASAPTAFDAVGYALRFQMNMMANLLRYFRKKYIQYRPLYDRLKEEHAETKRLKKLVDELKLENQQLRQHLHINNGDERTLHSNKRRRVDEDVSYAGHRTSSPRSTASVPTPHGPDRLTLPPGHHPPHFNSRQSIQSYESAGSQQSIA
ncbi:hypothetical protein OH76DRAFT_1336113 [Lentinus brumalis]|uniref:RING-type domain-containing protein n=1 Tax=Lentinus brumalis TaxID=2498619 RepID=A0A371DW83_9APHY|nr:hypothetical protein OH76DRAFT_1336113 [Polyporus brumalis]